MKSTLLLVVGLLVGVAGTSAFWMQREAKGANAFTAITQMNSDAMVLMGHQAAQALEVGSPDSLRDFANYVVDSGIYQAKRGTSSGAYTQALETKVQALPEDRRALSANAPQAIKVARQQIQ